MALAAMLGLVAIPGTAHAESPYGPMTLWDNIRYDTGAWQGWIQPSQPPGGMGESFAIAEDASDVHVDDISGSGFVDNIRYAYGGTWQGWEKPPQPPNGVHEISEASAPNGDIYFVAATASTLFYAVRISQTGRWSSWIPVNFNGAIPGNGILGTFAVAVDGYNEVQLIMWTGGGAIWHTMFNVYHDIRYLNGTWQGWRATSQPSPTGSGESACCQGAILSAAADLNGNVQFLLTYMDTGHDDRHISYHNIRNANGGWQGWRELLNAGSYCVPKITEQGLDYEDSEAHVDESCGNYYLWP